MHGAWRQQCMAGCWDSYWEWLMWQIMTLYLYLINVYWHKSMSCACLCLWWIMFFYMYNWSHSITEFCCQSMRIIIENLLAICWIKFSCLIGSIIKLCGDFKLYMRAKIWIRIIYNLLACILVEIYIFKWKISLILKI